MKRKMLLLTLALPVMLSHSAQAQTSSRLIAEAHWANNGAVFTPLDSTYYNYGSGMGGDLNHTKKYTTADRFDYLGDTAYTNTWDYIQTFDANGNIASTIVQFWNGTSWTLYSNTLFTYTSANLMATMILQSWGGSSWVPVSKNVYTYNVAGKLIIDEYQIWNSLTSAFESSSQKTYYYDAAGNKINETDQAFLPSPIYTDQWAYTYSATNQLLTTQYNTWNGSGWTPSTLYTNSYDTSGNMTNQLFQTYDLPATAWVNNTLHVYSGFTAGHMPMVDIVQHWDATGAGMWNNFMQFNYTYNSFNQMVTSTGISWNVVGIFEYALGDPRSVYYYSTFTPGTSSVKNVSTTGGEANIYPVPAQNMLHVDVKWEEAQPATIAIYDATGKVMSSWDAPAATEYHGAVSVNNLSTGVYFIKITGTQGQIVKQLVVAH